MHSDITAAGCSKLYPGKSENRTADAAGDYYFVFHLCGGNSRGDSGVLYLVSVLGYGASYDKWIPHGGDWFCACRYFEQEPENAVSAVSGVSGGGGVLFFYDNRRYMGVF